MSKKHSFFLIANGIAGAEKRFLNAFKASKQSSLILNEILFQTYVDNGLLVPGSPDTDRIIILKDSSLIKYLHKKFYLKHRFRSAYTFLNRALLTIKILSNRKLFGQFDYIHGVVEGTRYLGLIKHSNKHVHCFASVVNPTLEFAQKNSWLFSYKNCSHIDCLNVNIWSELVKLGYDKNRLSITPGTFTDYEKMPSRTKTRTISFSARLEEYKNPFVFLDIAEAFTKRYPGERIKFVVIGDGSAKAGMIRRVQTTPELMDIVEIKGFVSNPIDVLTESIIFVQLSKTEIHATQSMLEAMGSRCYIMVSHLPGIENVVKEEFGDILPLDAALFADKIKQHLDNFEATVQAGEQARAYAQQNFHVDNFLRYLFNCYEKAEQQEAIDNLPVVFKNIMLG